MKKIIEKILSTFFPELWKSYAELRFWKKAQSFHNEHYKFFYTEYFGLNDHFYTNKTILDIGCGPMGSLEWAHMAKRRVGLDPLVKQYLKLGAGKHKMEYIASHSESIPFEEDYFDIVCAFNSLDHVSDVNKTIKEIKRVTKPSGLFLLLVEVNHEPTNCEPHKLSPNIVDNFEPEFNCLQIDVFKPVESGCYQSVRNGEKFLDPYTDQAGWLTAKFQRIK
jgi:ubiquinone/menaquinone biosynthesis C-methylase UbiE